MPRIQVLAEGYEVMPGVRVVELGGHSPGSIGLEVETDDGLCVLTGDAIHSAAVARSGHNPLAFWDTDQADAAIRRCVDSGVTPDTITRSGFAEARSSTGTGSG